MCVIFKGLLELKAGARRSTFVPLDQDSNSFDLLWSRQDGFDEEHSENIKPAKLPRLNQIQCSVTTSIIFDRETALGAANW